MALSYRLPKARKGNRINEMHTVHDRLDAVLSKLCTGEKLQQVRLWQNWDMVMGPDIAPLARPLGVRNDLLLVGGDDNLALQDLSFMTPEILERVNAFMDAPVFNKVELRLIMGKATLDHAPDMQPVQRLRPLPERPFDLGGHLGEMRTDSPVARCYAAYLEMHAELECLQREQTQTE